MSARKGWVPDIGYSRYPISDAHCPILGSLRIPSSLLISLFLNTEGVYGYG